MARRLGEGRMIRRNTCPSWTGEWRVAWWEGNDGGNVSGGVVNEIGESVWNVEKNGGIRPLYPLRRRSGGGVERNGGTCPRQIDVGKNG